VCDEENVTVYGKATPVIPHGVVSPDAVCVYIYMYIYIYIIYIYIYIYMFKYAVNWTRGSLALSRESK